MKKQILPCMALVAALFVACNKESYYHTMGVQYPQSIAIIDADQTMDSVVFATTDNFQLSSDAGWMTVPDSMKTGRIQNYYHVVWEVRSPLLFEPNTTGRMRTALLSIRCIGDDDWDQTSTATFRQTHWLNITSPSPNYAYNEGVITDAAFLLTDSATQVADTLRFLVHGNWALTEGAFVHPTALQGEPGTHSVGLAIDPNPTYGEREEQIVLTSNGVSTSITVKQKGRKEDAED